ncbi:GAF domain-containing protein [Tychonema sp. LEGE 07199]|uniref:GAF domain-containing protein n=1 Tax=unclassified Tychonema TaxID=2642144 RepID=UPI0018818CA1|nr:MULTISPECIES: GAF domain-containing protein [unclassified Tychonema]MBE9121837.1 GAF domain-containing protein [Tychonema sp. LEGE 07199]MBE9130951.1 GAF domain-containing protein [Tychonema sp. LEGE 07196]
MQLTENTQEELNHKLDREILVRRITERIRQSLELEEILTTAVAEMRSFLKTDRIMIYRFSADCSGEVVAESINNNRLPSLKGLHFPADDIPPHAREMYVRMRQRTIIDVNSGRIVLSPLDAADTGQPLLNEETHYRALDPCHTAYLMGMGVQSSFVVPILHRRIVSKNSQTEDMCEAPACVTRCEPGSDRQTHIELWGLLVAHHSVPRNILPTDLEVVQLVADQLSNAIGHSILLHKIRSQAAREATVSRIAAMLYGHANIQLQQALEATVAAFGGSGGRIYLNAPNVKNSEKLSVKGDRAFAIAAQSEPTFELFATGEQPTLSNGETPGAIEAHPLWQQWLSKGFKNTEKIAKFSTFTNSQFPAWIITDLYKESQFRVLFPAFQATKIRGLLVIPLHHEQQVVGCLTIFRNEIDTEKMWAGRFDSSAAQTLPRQSFEVWREIKKGQSPEWKREDIEQALAIGSQFCAAIGQYLLYKEVQALNANLERQVQERTAQLQKSLDFARVLTRVRDQIRSTLDLKTILQTIVREVRVLLDTDRTVIYQFTAAKQGEVVVEAVRGEWESILGLKSPQECFPEGSDCFYRAGRVRAINDIETEDLTPCHREFLEKLQVRGSLIVPMMGTDTECWGLLIAHECSAPRVWQTAEQELLQHLASQAAIAIHQAELYQESLNAATADRDKAEQLAKTLTELNNTQAQLIQTEKMSSLGQLVAGVAHEINNPVNFIYGNLSHASEYSKDLLCLVELYRQHYPNPHPEISECSEAIDVEFLAADLPKILTSMKVGSERIRQLVVSLRNFSRLDQAQKKPVDIHEGIDSTMLILQHRCKSQSDRPSVEIIKEYGNLPLVECYASSLNQVFMNLIGNAIDALEMGQKEQIINVPGLSASAAATYFSSQKQEIEPADINGSSESLIPDFSYPSIRIRTELIDETTVGICIADNGHGIPKELISHIFNPFFTTKPVGRGTGLGLSISYQIVVEKHQGTLKCISVPGRGTEFWIEIPVN